MTPNTVAEFLYLSSKLGWSREALNVVPWYALADWCREQGWEEFADKLQELEYVRGAVKQSAEDDTDYRLQWLNGAVGIWLRAVNDVITEHLNKAARG